MAAAGNSRFFERLCERCCQEGLREAGRGGFEEIETVIISMKAELLGRASVKQF
ncbi:hypothetical protein D3C73_1616870 [compost metagenome]